MDSYQEYVRDMVTKSPEQKVAALIEAGTQLANCAYNIAQRGSASTSDIQSLREARLAWDQAKEKL